MKYGAELRLVYVMKAILTGQQSDVILLGLILLQNVVGKMDF
jgi:hypothetical protein